MVARPSFAKAFAEVDLDLVRVGRWLDDVWGGRRRGEGERDRRGGE